MRRLGFTLQVSACVLLLATDALALPVDLYDVDFNSDPIGQPVPSVPVASAPALGRTHPTGTASIPGAFEPPIVVASVGALNDLPALFNPLVEDYSQLEFKIGSRVLDWNLPCWIAAASIEECLTVDPQRDSYVLDVDILPISLSRPFASTGGFSIMLDAPGTNRIDFTSDGIIGLYREDQGTRAIGRFVLGEILKLHVEMDFIADRLSISTNGQLLAVDPWAAIELTTIRMGTQSLGTDLIDKVAVDNIRITAIPEPSTGFLMLFGLGGLSCRRRQARGPDASPS